MQLMQISELFSQLEYGICLKKRISLVWGVNRQTWQKKFALVAVRLFNDAVKIHSYYEPCINYLTRQVWIWQP